MAKESKTTKRGASAASARLTPSKARPVIDNEPEYRRLVNEAKFPATQDARQTAHCPFCKGTFVVKAGHVLEIQQLRKQLATQDKARDLLRAIVADVDAMRAPAPCDDYECDDDKAHFFFENDEGEGTVCWPNLSLLIKQARKIV